MLSLNNCKQVYGRLDIRRIADFLASILGRTRIQTTQASWSY